MKLHWSPRAPFVRKVMICAHELGVADRLALVRSQAALTQPNAAIMVDNPLSKIPTLVLDDGRTLFDSVVICEYLDALAGGTLFPREGAARWAALRWHALADGMLDALILWRFEREQARPHAALVAAFDTKITAAVARLEAEVDALAAAPFSIGTITVGCALGYLDFRFAAWRWRDRAPRLAAWYAALVARPSFVATVAVDDSL